MIVEEPVNVITGFVVSVVEEFVFELALTVIVPPKVAVLEEVSLTVTV